MGEGSKLEARKPEATIIVQAGGDDDLNHGGGSRNERNGRVADVRK